MPPAPPGLLSTSEGPAARWGAPAAPARPRPLGVHTQHPLLPGSAGLSPRQSTEMLPLLSQQAVRSCTAGPANTECLLKEPLASGSVHFTC